MSASVLTPRMQATLRRATEIAEARSHNYVGTEHVLLALLDDPDGIAGGVLHRLQVAERARAEVERILSSAGYARVGSDTPRPG
jgi:ATP-dependent Clp protease ATP-binding subunit ClpC